MLHFLLNRYKLTSYTIEKLIKFAIQRYNLSFYINHFQVTPIFVEILPYYYVIINLEIMKTYIFIKLFKITDMIKNSISTISSNLQREFNDSNAQNSNLLTITRHPHLYLSPYIRAASERIARPLKGFDINLAHKDISPREL